MLKAIVKSLDKVDEAFHSLYQKTSDGFILKVEGADSLPEVVGLKTNRDELLKDVSRVRGERDQFKEVDLKEWGRLKTEEEARLAGKHKEENDWDAREATLKAANQKTVDDKDAEIKSLRGAVRRFAAESPAKTALANMKGSEALLLPVVMGRIDVRQQGENWVPVVLNEAGDPAVADGQGGPVTVEKLVETLKEDPKYAPAFEASGSSGSGGPADGGDGTPPQSGEVIRGWGETELIGDNLEKIAKGEVTVTP